MTAIDAPKCRWCRYKLPRGSYVHIFKRSQRTEELHPDDNRVFREMRDEWQAVKAQTDSERKR